MPGNKPPKEFWNKHYKTVKEKNPKYTEEQIAGTVAKMWINASPEAKAPYNKMRERREGKEINKALSMEHINEDLGEFKQILTHIEAVSKIVKSMIGDDKKAKAEMGKSLHFIEIAESEAGLVPTGMDVLEIK